MSYVYFQILTLFDCVDQFSVDKIVEYVQGLQQEDGSFCGDKWGKYQSITVGENCQYYS